MVSVSRHVSPASPASGIFVKHEPRAPRVLLAEDDDEMRELLAEELRHDGYEVLEARDGLEMEARLKSVRHCPLTAPDVIVMDHRMRGHTGLEILCLLREASWSTPVVLMTAFPEGELVEAAERLGAKVFVKPFDIDELRFAVVSHKGARGVAG